MSAVTKRELRKPEQSPELESLKETATKIGLKYHPNIGLDKLRGKVNAKLNSEPDTSDSSDDQSEPMPTVGVAEVDPDKQFRKRETPAMRKARLRKKAIRLHHVRIVCMNPNKKEWKGEIITVINSVIGTVKRYVPFNAPMWHVEDCILEVLRDRQYTKHFAAKSKSGRPATRQSQEKEFAIEMLPPLTKKELSDLAKEQSISGRIEDEE